MKKYTVVIEETVAGEFEIIAETEKEALEIAHKKYKKNEFILEPGEVQCAQMAIVNSRREELKWIEA